jgi:hypothetical protein
MTSAAQRLQIFDERFYHSDGATWLIEQLISLRNEFLRNYLILSPAVSVRLFRKLCPNQVNPLKRGAII